MKIIPLDLEVLEISGPTFWGPRQWINFRPDTKQMNVHAENQDPTLRWRNFKKNGSRES